MAGFTESALQKKLEDLNESQQSIQTLSLWLIHHRKHHQLIVKTWFREMCKGNEIQKLTLMYLANDVIQNSKKKGPEYSKEYVIYLRKAFRIISNTKFSDKTKNKLDRILQIWEERNVYDKKIVDEFKDILYNKKVDDESFEESTPPKRPRVISKAGSKLERKIAEVEIDGKKEVHVRLSPVEVTGDPPEPEELVKALIDLENSASVDVVVREKISKLPPDVSEVKLLAKIEDRDAALRLAERVNAAVELLTDYNNRLGHEMEERKRVMQMLRDFAVLQKQLLQQAETRLEEYKEKLIKVEQVRHEVLSHVANLPDLRQLPDVTSGKLAPLPSAGDLFNVIS